MAFFAVSFLHPHQSLQLVLHPAVKFPVRKSTATGSSQRAASTGEVGHALRCSMATGIRNRPYPGATP